MNSIMILYTGMAIFGSGITLTLNKYIRQTGLLLTGIGAGLIGLSQIISIAL